MPSTMFPCTEGVSCLTAVFLAIARGFPWASELLPADGLCTSCSGAGDAEHFGAHAAAADVSPKRLKELLTYPTSWGPSEWGPISFLPEHDLLVSNMERQWGDLDKYRGLATSAKGTGPLPCSWSRLNTHSHVVLMPEGHRVEGAP